jgi:hypothetical protein
MLTNLNKVHFFHLISVNPEFHFSSGKYYRRILVRFSHPCFSSSTMMDLSFIVQFYNTFEIFTKTSG